MATSTNQLEWCDVQFDDDSHWWVQKFDPSTRWEFDQLGIIDPRQLQHILESLDSLREYGLQDDIVDKAFFKFRLEDELKNKENTFRLERVRTSLYNDDLDDALFVLPDDMDEERGPYEDFMRHILRVRVRMLNNLIDNDQPLTVEEVDAEIKEALTTELGEDEDPHYFDEISAVLEYTPEGTDNDDLQNLDDDDAIVAEVSDPELDEGFEEIDEDDESFRQDKEALNWDQEEEEEIRKRNNPEYQETLEDLEEEEETAAPKKRGRPRKKD
jgi:hypothetical protein